MVLQIDKVMEEDESYRKRMNAIMNTCFYLREKIFFYDKVALHIEVLVTNIL